MMMMMMMMMMMVMMMAREIEREVPEGYEGPTSPTDRISAESVERRIEETKEELYLSRVTAKEAEAASGLELRHKLFTNVIQIRTRQKEMEEQSQRQEACGTSEFMFPICVKVIACNDEYRDAYLAAVEKMSGHEEFAFLA